MPDGIEIHNARLSGTATAATPSSSTPACSAQGFLFRDCQRMVNQDRNVFAACMVATGDADAHGHRPDPLRLGLPGRHRPRDRPGPGRRSPFGLTLMLGDARPTPSSSPTRDAFPPRAPSDWPTSSSAPPPPPAASGHEPRVALLSLLHLRRPGHDRRRPDARRGRRCWTAASVDFEYDGEMSADVALDPVDPRACIPSAA